MVESFWLEIFFLTLSIVLLGYYLLVWKKLADYKSPAIQMSELPFVSVVICAKNERENLKNFLPKILNQNYPNYEVVLVDDLSDDGTAGLLNKFSFKYKNFRPFKFEKPKKSFGKKEVLEFGISEARGEYLVMTDADCYPKSENWLVSIVNGFENGTEIVFGVGQYEYENTLINKLIQLDTGFIALNYLSFALVKMPYMSVGRNVAYKKDLFKKVGGFKSHYSIPSGDDDLFVNELPKKTKVGIVTSPKSQTVSVPKLYLKSYFRQKIRHVSAGISYSWVNILRLSVFYTSAMLWYFILPLVIYYSDQIIIVLTIVVLKKLTMYSLISRIFSKIGIRVNYGMIFLTEFISVFFHNTAVLVTFFKSKKGTW